MVHDFGTGHHEHGHNCMGASSVSRVTTFKLYLPHSMGIVTYDFGKTQ